MGLDTKTYWLTDRQSQCNFDFDFDFVTWESWDRSWLVGWLVGWCVSGLFREVLGFSLCELLLLEADNWARRDFVDPAVVERTPLEAATKQQLVKVTVNISVCRCVIV
jgi:hypothetical protein